MSNDLSSLSGIRPAAAPSLASSGGSGRALGSDGAVAVADHAAPDPREVQRSVEEAVDLLNEQMRSNGRDLAFSIDRVVDRTIITVRNTQTGEVVRQIPDEALLRVAHNIELAKGVLFNEVL